MMMTCTCESLGPPLERGVISIRAELFLEPYDVNALSGVDLVGVLRVPEIVGLEVVLRVLPSQLLSFSGVPSDDLLVCKLELFLGLF